MALAAAFLAITVAAGADEPLGTEAAAAVLQQHMLPRGEPLVPADENHQCFNSTNPHFSCDAAPCFCNATWDDHEVQSIDGLLFSAKYNLSLHMFKPPSTDVRLKRPAMVMIHGGGFINGNRDDKKDLIEWCMELAMRGYVAVSIDYRINKTMMQTDSETSMVWAAHDAKAAVRWLRANAAKYRIDADRIGVFGSSAGAMTTIFMSALATEGDSGSPGFSSSVSAAVSLSGALACIMPTNASQCQCNFCVEVNATLPPWLDFHGCDDSTVPYGPCGDDDAKCWGSGVDTVAALKAAGAPAALYSFPGAGHVPWGDLAKVDAASAFLGFLAINLDLGGAECPKEDESGGLSRGDERPLSFV